MISSIGMSSPSYYSPAASQNSPVMGKQGSEELTTVSLLVHIIIILIVIKIINIRPRVHTQLLLVLQVT